MAKYYYLISSLPMLKANEALPISYDEFLTKCSEQLSKGDYEEIKKATLSPSEGAKYSLMKKWEDYIKIVDSALKDERLKKLGWADGSEKTSAFDSSLKERIHRAVYLLNPLEGEREVLNIYFDFLSSNETLSPFDFETLMIYALKIQIMERMNSFDPDMGKEQFDKLFKNIQSQFS